MTPHQHTYYCNVHLESGLRAGMWLRRREIDSEAESSSGWMDGWMDGWCLAARSEREEGEMEQEVLLGQEK